MKPRNKGLEPSYKIKCALRLASAFSAGLLGVLFSIAFFLHFEPETSLFKAGSILIRITMLLAVIISVILAVLTFALIRKTKAEEQVFPVEAEYKPYYKIEPVAIKTSRYVVAALIMGELAVKCFLVLRGKSQIFLSPFLSSVMLLLSIPLVLFFLPEVANKLTPEYEKTHLFFGSFGLIRFLLEAVNIYFDNTVAYSSPYRILNQISLLLVMLMLVYEIKFHTDTPFTRARLASLLAAFTLASSFTLGRVVMLISGKSVSVYDTATVFAMVGLSVYMGVKLYYYDED